jgi:membrane-associated protease RseP (regulator of RpoE activity)
LSFGKLVVLRPIAVLYTGTKGDNASREYDGLIGGGIFRRFKMTVDIPGRRLFLEPGPNVDEPFDMDMSGLEILADGPDLKTFLVDEVRPDSAGAKAGILEGDTIEAIDGQRAQELGIDEIHRLLRKDGGSYDVTVLRKGMAVHVRLVLKRVI